MYNIHSVHKILTYSIELAEFINTMLQLGGEKVKLNIEVAGN
jgi:hypothetical protein